MEIKTKQRVVVETDIEKNVQIIGEKLNNLKNAAPEYDAQKLSISLVHLLTQLEYFYCKIAKGKYSSEICYRIQKSPKSHQLAYVNLGRGFPKEIADGHFCYIVKNFGSKMLVIPATSIKDDGKKNQYELDICSSLGNKTIKSRIQISDIRTVDVQRIDVRKPFYTVQTPQRQIYKKIIQILFDTGKEKE